MGRKQWFVEYETPTMQVKARIAPILQTWEQVREALVADFKAHQEWKITDLYYVLDGGVIRESQFRGVTTESLYH